MTAMRVPCPTSISAALAALLLVVSSAQAQDSEPAETPAPTATPAPTPSGTPAATSAPSGEAAADLPENTQVEPALAFPGAGGILVGDGKAESSETHCSDRKDDDGDGLVDCEDSDCVKAGACKSDGSSENTNARCSDWIDNDGDGYLDCDDRECEGPGITVCQGSWVEPTANAVAAVGSDDGETKSSASDDDIPALGEGMSVLDLIGTGDDADGERNDQLCSDGLDNDNDGKTDCADFGCRFDPAVNVCRGNPGLRFSVVAGVSQSYDIENDEWDTRFTRLQLRAFGPLPMIDNSFFLISSRFERTPRLTFAMFQLPLWGQHRIGINSGGGGLSSALVLSAAKQLLLEAPFYVYNAFEQGNGAAIEVEGPIIKSGRLRYRVFAAGGTGRFSGNVGGRFLAEDDENYTWAVGSQLQVNLIGFYSRWDNPFIYTPSPTTLGFAIGGRYDQRSFERYPALNFSGTFRWKRLIMLWEAYGKRELEFESWQYSYNLQVGFLAVPKWVLLAADFGEYRASDVDNPPASPSPTLARQLRDIRDERQWRVATHLYLWRNIGLLSLLYVDRRLEGLAGAKDQVEREVTLQAQYRF